VKECSRNPSKLLGILLLALCVILCVPEEVPAPMDTLWKEVISGVLKWKNSQKAEYAWTGREALQISLLCKPFQPFPQCLNASHPSSALLSHQAYDLPMGGQHPGHHPITVSFASTRTLANVTNPIGHMQGREGPS